MHVATVTESFVARGSGESPAKAKGRAEHRS